MSRLTGRAIALGSTETLMPKTVKGATLYLALWRTTRELQQVAEGNIADSGLCLTDFAVLEALLHGGPLRVSTIAEKVLLTSGSMTSAIDRLAARGLVERVLDPRDARARLIELTDTGRGLIEPVFAQHSAALDAAVGGLGVDERGQLLRLLLALRSTIRGDATSDAR
jgi:MarR family 2-MHQ and catechol resistance regulon transcriptional repressor